MLASRLMVLVLMVMLGGCGGGGGTSEAVTGSPSVLPPPVATVQEQQCQGAGWQRAVVPAAGLSRLVLWKAPADGVWRRGAIVVMHGGGGSHTNFCVANVPQIEAQVRFTSQALAAGFAVFLLDSSDRVLDSAGRLCGKVWDDEPRARANLDLPFIDLVLGEVIPARRPASSRAEVFFTGLSSGGYMALRAATRFGDRITAFAPVSSGDPYGWVRNCTPLASDRSNVFGVALDRETGRNISEAGACRSVATPNEATWDLSPGGRMPTYRQFHHDGDAIHDLSCVEKADAQLVARGYPRQAPFRLSGSTREAAWHMWLDDYAAPMLEFFGGFIR